MKCRDIRPMLSAYLDNELESGEEKAVFDHISGCPSCAREIQDMRNAVAVLGQFSTVTEPPDFTSSLQERLSGKSLMRRGRKFKPVFLLPAAACFLLVFIFSIILLSKKEYRYYLSFEASSTSLSTEKGERQEAPALLYTRVINILKENDFNVEHIEEGEGIIKEIHITIVVSDYHKLLGSIQKLGNVDAPDLYGIPEDRKIIIIIKIR